MYSLKVHVTFGVHQIECVESLVDQTGATASVLYQHNTVTPQQQQYPKSEFNAVLAYGTAQTQCHTCAQVSIFSC